MSGNVRDEWERQLFASVSKGRARQCLWDGAEEAVSWSSAGVGPLKSRGVWAQAAASSRGGVGMVPLSRCFAPQS